MDVKYFKWYSYSLNREMEYKVYGSRGVPFFYFPTQYKRFFEAEDEGVIATLSYLIDSGKLFVVAVDNIDYESLSNFNNWDKRKRLERQESYFEYVINELYPSVNNLYKFSSLPIAFGMSFGAFQAMNMFLRKPQLFGGVFAMSGIYKITFFFNDYYDELAFLNSPIDSLNLLKNNEYLNLYKKRNILLVVSNGAYESEALHDTYELEKAFNKNGIPISCYYWTKDYPHDWSSWKIYLNYYIKNFL